MIILSCLFKQSNDTDTSNSGTSMNGPSSSTVIETNHSNDTSSNFPSLSSSSNVWTNLKFQGEHGSAMTEKFRKLMGIKSTNTMEINTATTDDCNALHTAPNNPKKKLSPRDDSDRLFERLDAQYEQARAATHTNRGMGLGYK